jgi:single-stranded-DNA-specific exonuclease
MTEIRNHLPENYLVLTNSSEEEVERVIKVLLEKSSSRRELIKELTEFIEDKIESSSNPFFILEGGKELSFSLTGAVASRVANKYEKPIFIFANKNGLIRGSVRSLQGINSVEVLKHCSRFLLGYGGHAPASGFTLKEENLENFRNCLSNYFKNLKNGNSK